jgi:hypothetical protein
LFEVSFWATQVGVVPPLDQPERAAATQKAAQLRIQFGLFVCLFAIWQSLFMGKLRSKKERGGRGQCQGHIVQCNCRAKQVGVVPPLGQLERAAATEKAAQVRICR